MNSVLLIFSLALLVSLVVGYSPMTAIRGIIGNNKIITALNSTFLGDESDTAEDLSRLHNDSDAESTKEINELSSLQSEGDDDDDDSENSQEGDVSPYSLINSTTGGVAKEQVRLDDGANNVISEEELQQTLQDSIKAFSESKEQTIELGWKLVHENDLFTLFKRRDSTLEGSPGPVQYMMKGILTDVSPRTFLHVQVNKALREGWDTTMASMDCDPEQREDSKMDDYIMDGVGSLEDKIYYRTKWPWPLKDRDYTLARRAAFYDDQDAIVFVSRATDMPAFAKRDGVIRVENYWCQSAYFSPSRYKNGNETSSAQSREMKVEKRAEVGRQGEVTKIKQSLAPPPVRIGKGENLKRFMQSTLSHGLDGPKHLAGNVAGRIGKTAGDTFHFGQQLMKARAGGGGVTEAAANGAHSGVRRRLSHDEVKASVVSQPGTGFVTIFCDDAKVPLPSRIVDLIASKAEKQVPDSINKLHDAARVIQK